MAELLRLARAYEHADWRTLRMHPSNPVWKQWITMWSSGLVPDFAHVAPEHVPPAVCDMDYLVHVDYASLAGAVPGCPGLPFRACAHVSCRNVTGLSERSVRTYVCGGCMSARFCSKACARNAHALHKVHCRK